MPVGVPIESIPSQKFSIVLDSNLYQLAIRQATGVVVVSVTRNGVDIIDNLIAAAAAPIIPAKYQEAGNFMFLTANNQLPNYQLFNISQSLFYFTADELAAFRTSPTPPVNAAFFDPVGALPLRFAPQGYVIAP